MSNKELKEIQELKVKIGELAKELGNRLGKLEDQDLDDAAGSLQVDGEKFELKVGISKLNVGPKKIRTVTADRLMHSENNMT